MNQALTELTRTVVSLKTMRGGTPSSSPSSSSRTSSPSPLITMVGDFDEESHSSADLDSNMVKFILNVILLYLIV